MPSVRPSSVLQFGDFELDCGSFELRRKGVPLRVERKPMELLILLASRDGQLVTRQEIAERLWSREVFVDTEHGINTAIRKIRYLLRDDPNDPRFVQTVTKMGYRFVAPLSAVSLFAPAAPAGATLEPGPVTGSASRRNVLGWMIGASVCMILALAVLALHRFLQRPQEVRFTPLTDFTDSAVAPALSPDGRMVAFIRGGESFLTSDQIYAKMLPDGESRRVTDDARPKYGLAFSPDGSEIAYTVLDTAGFSTYEVSALGGEPHLLLKNAAGLVWLDPQRLLFSEIRTGIHLGVVTATVTRASQRDIYFPAHDRGMAHYAFPSPNRQVALVVEMNGNGEWAECRLVGLDMQSQPRSVGPAGACTTAGWSPDGGWMYFTAWVQGQSHIWRQRFPVGVPEQITFGPTEEEGIAVEPEGRALITSVGLHESAIWIRDGSVERQLSSEGEVASSPSPVFSPDSNAIYYLRAQENSGGELWRTMVNSGKNEAVLPGVSVTFFDLSPDGRQVVYTTEAPGGTTQLWVTTVDRSSSPTRVSVSGAQFPHFGQQGQILFQHAEGNANYLEKIDLNGSDRSKVLPYPIDDFQSVSPSRRWVVVAVPKGSKELAPITAIPLDGGAPRRICAGYCFPRWSTGGKFLFVPVVEASRTSPGRALAIPLGPGESLPELPLGGIAPSAQPDVVHGAESVGRFEFAPGDDPDHYAWVNITVHRNLYRVSLP